MATQAMAAQGWLEGTRQAGNHAGNPDEIAERNQLLLHAQQRARRGPTRRSSSSRTSTIRGW